MSLNFWHWFLLIQALLRILPTVAKVPAIVVFGDSTVDTGNNNYIGTVVKSNFKPYGRDFDGGNATGRFSNGRLAVDFISEAFGLPGLVPAYLDPIYTISNFASGVCFASAATGYDNATSDVFSVIPLWKQLEYYEEYQDKLKKFQDESQAQETISEALYIMSIGTNDFLENYYTMPGGRSSEFTVPQYEDFLVGIAEDFIRSLYKLGARKIQLTGIPPMGCLPFERSKKPLSLGDCNEEYNKVAADFNLKLTALMDRLNVDLPDIRIVYGDVYEVLLDVVRNQSSYGIENVVEGCCGTGLFEMGYLCNSRDPLTCSDANKYAFWDAIHPTQRLDHIIAERLMNTTLHIFL